MSNDWIEHNGGPQPVDDDVWVETSQRHGLGEDSALAGALDWRHIERSRDIVRYRILNQHLIDAARLEGIRLGLEAAAKVADLYSNKKVVSHIRWLQPDIIAAIQKPDTIAKEAQHD